MTKSKLVISSILASIIAASSITYASKSSDHDDNKNNCGGGKHSKMKKGHHGMMGGEDKVEKKLERMAEHLDLTSEQQASIKSIMDADLPMQKELHEKMRASHEQMAELDSDASDYTTKINEYADQQGNLMAEMIKSKAAMDVKIESKLTDDQRQARAEMKEKKKENME